MNRWVIFGAAEIRDYDAIRPKIQTDDVIVCADGGYRHLEPLGLRADLILGDFDSAPKPETDAELLTFPVEKDDTDMMLAVKEGLRRGCRSFLLFGGTGGRFDHTYANLQTLLYAEKHGASAALADERSMMFLLKNDTAYIEKNEGEKVSVFAFDPICAGVTLTGFYYPLQNGTLYSHVPLGAGNHIIEPQGKITVRKGTLLVVISKEEAV